MSRFRGHRFVAYSLATVLCLGGCAPSYRSTQIPSTIQQICTDEYKMNVTVKMVGHTLAVHLHHEGILEAIGNRIELADTANEILGNVIEVIHRVILSSDAEIRFYLVLASDPKVPGVAFSLVRYLDDVKRANANMLTPTEFYSRTVFDLRQVGTVGLSLDQLVPGDIQMEQFLSWQLAKRIQGRLAETMQRRGTAVPELQCVGEFQQGEFAFTLGLEPKPGATTDSDVIQQAFQDAAVVIAQVLSDYRFEKFDTVRLIHPTTGRSLLLPKTRLELLK